MPQNTETYTYNAVGALKLKQFKKGGTVLDSHDYGYNPDEMIQDVTRLGGVKVEYGYDNIGQLTSAKGKEADGTTLRLNEQLGYGYDASHNLAVRTNATLIQTFTSDSRHGDHDGTLDAVGLIAMGTRQSESIGHSNERNRVFLADCRLPHTLADMTAGDCAVGTDVVRRVVSHRLEHGLSDLH